MGAGENASPVSYNNSFPTNPQKGGNPALEKAARLLEESRCFGLLRRCLRLAEQRLPDGFKDNRLRLLMDRGEIVHEGPAEDLDRPDVRRHLMV